MLTTKIETITPELAADYLKFNTKNRNYSQYHARNIANQIKKGLWLLDGNAIRFSENGNLLDGQHRLHAIILAGMPVQSLVVRGLPDDAFKNIDTGKTRSGGDILSIDGVQNATIVSGSIVKYDALHNGRQVIYGNGNKESHISNIRSTLSKPQIVEFYRANKSVCDAVGQHAAAMGRGSNGIKIYPAAYIGGYELFLILDKHHKKEVVFEFFEELTTGIYTNDSIRILRDKMASYNSGTIPLTASQRTAYLVKTWNAFIKGKTITRLTYSTNDDANLQMI